jgi:hypothetical protein
MKYVLIANNKKININKLKICKDDLIVLFGQQYPLIFDNIKHHQNKILFLRNNEHNPRSTIKTNHQETLIDNHHLYKYIILYPKNNINFLIDSIHDFNKNKIIYIYDKIFALEDYQHFPLDYVPTTGFIAYLYIKYYLNKDNSEIILFGFDGDALWRLHNAKYEQCFYKLEMSNNSKVKLDIGY